MTGYNRERDTTVTPVLSAISGLNRSSFSECSDSCSEAKRPLCIDLFCGLGGWAQGFLAEGYEVIGFDIERHNYGTGGYPGQLVLQDVQTLHGSQFRDAAVIVASPPCQAYSYRAMPWKRAKALPPPDNTLFEACFRIAREAGVPIVVENVCGAQKWVGRAKWHYGSFYLWGDVPALMPVTHSRILKGGDRNKNRAIQHAWTNSFADTLGQKLPGNNAPRMWAERRIQRLRDCQEHPLNNSSSGSSTRKAASANIAKIPFPLANWIAKCFKPQVREEVFSS